AQPGDQPGHEADDVQHQRLIQVLPHEGILLVVQNKGCRVQSLKNTIYKEREYAQPFPAALYE
ncbi:MAG: hypothetical protein IKD86_00960, partial [Firmicutes bacterium]|nr:hypothetical protein [Bacillota bacterium]